MTVSLRVREAAPALLDEPFLLTARADEDTPLVWRARYRDDDERVWRATAETVEELTNAWAPAKAKTGSVAALRSLRPVRIDVRVEAPDGAAASRTLTRRLVADGVRLRRWRDGLAGTLHIPADAEPRATVIADATAGEHDVAVASVAAPLLASRGVLTLVVAPVRGGAQAADAIETARERLAAVPAAAAREIHVLPDAELVLPPNVGAGDDDPGAAAARAATWDALIARLGARPRAR
jgi:hypothetical protein